MKRFVSSLFSKPKEQENQPLRVQNLDLNSVNRDIADITKGTIASINGSSLQPINPSELIRHSDFDFNKYSPTFYQLEPTTQQSVRLNHLDVPQLTTDTQLSKKDDIYQDSDSGFRML